MPPVGQQLQTDQEVLVLPISHTKHIHSMMSVSLKWLNDEALTGGTLSRTLLCRLKQPVTINVGRNLKETTITEEKGQIKICTVIEEKED